MPVRQFLTRSSMALLLASVLAGPALAQQGAREGVEVGEKSWATKVGAEQTERAGAQAYLQTLQEAQQKRELLPADHPQVQRLREIARRIVPHAKPWNPRANEWQWEVNVIASSQLNAFCMPGGKIAFFYGILDKLKLSDDEVAAIMGHEVAHALREHAHERMVKSGLMRGGASLLSAWLGLGNLGDLAAGMSVQLLTMKFGRGDESEADLIGMELAARAGYDPAAGVSLWQKMGQVSKGAPPQWLSTHPSGPSRIKEIEANLPKVQGLYQRAAKPARRYEVAPPLTAKRN